MSMYARAIIASLATAGLAVATSNTVYDVAIVGGGSAGTYAAIGLLDSKKSVIVIEKSDELGGNANTYVDPTTKTPINVGVRYFHNLTFVTDYAERLGVPLVNPGRFAFPTKYYDFDTGKTVPKYHPASDAAIGQAVFTYIGLLENEYPYLEGGWNLPNPVPSELLLPFGEFAKMNNLTAAVQTFSGLLQNNGDIWKIPAIRVLESIDLSLAYSILEGFLVVESGNTRDLYTSAEKILQGSVMYKSTVTSVDRSAGLTTLKVDTPKGTKTVVAKTLLIAIPPTLENLKPFSLSNSERTLFGKFKSNGYFGAVIRNTGINSSDIFTNIGAKTPFHLQNLPGIFDLAPTGLPDMYEVYYGTFSSSVTSVQAQKGMVSQINTLASNGAFDQGTTEFLDFVNHSPYVMYVSADEIKNGFYSRLYALQGQQSTFWTGAAWIAQDSSLIWQYTNTTVLPQVLAALNAS